MPYPLLGALDLIAVPVRGRVKTGMLWASRRGAGPWPTLVERVLVVVERMVQVAVSAGGHGRAQLTVARIWSANLAAP